MKTYLTFLLLCCIYMANAQISNSFSFKDKLLEKKDSKWLIADKKHPKKFYDVDSKVITVKFNVISNEGLDKLKEKFNVKLIRKASTGYTDIEIPQGYDILQFARILQELDYIKDVEINAFGEYGAFTPDDTYYNNQWYLSKIKAPNTWNFIQGNPCIVVAILDSGTDWLHEDLGNGSDNFNNIWHNTGEDVWSVDSDPTTGNGIDDDGNGFIDDWIG